MMKVGFAVAIILTCVMHAFSDNRTEEEERLVVRELVLNIQRSSEWNDLILDSASTNAIQRTYTSYEDLFSENLHDTQVGSNWTVAERRAAFEHFLDAIPELSTNGLYATIVPDAGIALGFCVEFSYTNSLEVAKRIISTPSSVARNAAMSAVRAFATADANMNGFVEGIMTNGVVVSERTRGELLSSYARILERDRLTCDRQTFSNGVRIVCNAVSGAQGAFAVDHLLLTAYPDYSTSSNRLVIAAMALTDASRMSEPRRVMVHDYFTPVTNQLINATQPLLQLQIPAEE